jgi:hypothetical protein
MKALSIVGWDDLYETAETKKLKNLSWVPTPNSHNSLGFCELLSHPNGMAHYGAWNLILQVASKCPVRGLLVSGRNKVHDARSIALVTRGSERMIQEAIPRLIEIGWLSELELGESPGTTGEDPGKTGEDPGTPVLKGREGKGKEGEGTPAASPHPSGEPSPPKPGERTKSVLLGLGLRATAETAQEWAQMAQKRGRCQTPEDVLAFIPWAVKRGKKEGVTIQYARDAATFADEWARRTL